ncbi:hypothetical protein [Flavobacterium sp. N502540]|nr:hypothetical protein [Flavobacterium sp. N502540]
MNNTDEADFHRIEIKKSVFIGLNPCHPCAILKLAQVTDRYQIEFI